MDATTRASVDRMELAGYLPALRAIAQGACAPFWWHGTATDGAHRIHHNGTVCFVNTGKRLIGVTAHHVLAGYRAALEFQPALRCQFGSATVEPLRHLIAESQYLDLATFDLSNVVVAATGAAPTAPPIWPTSLVSTSGSCFMAASGLSAKRAEVHGGSSISVVRRRTHFGHARERQATHRSRELSFATW